MTEIIIFIIGLAVLLFLIYVFVFLYPGNKRKRKMPSELLVDYAHRGLHDAESPENSLAAFRKAVEAGYGIELDVQLSKDGEVMVFHDYSLERMTGDKRKLSDLTADELRALLLKDTDERIPYLTEVLDLVDGKVPLLIELKGESADTSLCPKVAEILSGYNGPYCIESFNPMLLYWYRKNRPQVILGILTTRATKDRGITPLNLILDSMMLNFLYRPDFIAYDHRYNKLGVRICSKLFGTQLFAWTIRDCDTYSKLPEVTSSIFEGFKPNHK